MKLKTPGLWVVLCLFASCAEQNTQKKVVEEVFPADVLQQQVSPSPHANTNQGQTVFTTYCMACHQKDGSGVPGMYPPLQKSDWVNGDKKRLINILLNGLQGDIEVNGETYSQTMPKQDYLTNKQIAQVLSFVRQNFGNKADSVRVKDVGLIRKK